METKNEGGLQRIGDVCGHLYLGLGFTFGNAWEKSIISDKLEVSVSDIDGAELEEQK